MMICGRRQQAAGATPMHIADDVIVRAERVDDRPHIDSLIRAVFSETDVADRVNRTRDTPAFIPEFSLVGEVDDEILGYVLLTRATIDGVDPGILALGPLAVTSHRRRGIGMVLVKSALHFAEIRGVAGVVVAGPESYFRRFGFQPAERFGITPAFELGSGDSFLALPLSRAQLPIDGGVLRYGADVYPLN